MIGLIISWIVITVAILLAAYILPGVYVRSIGAAIVAAAVLGLLNVLVKPILEFLGFPLTLITFGLFLLVINGIVFHLTARLVSGLHVRSFGWSILAAIVISVVTIVARKVGLI